MISSDKLFTFGFNGAVAAGLCYIGIGDLSTRALSSTLGGVAASTLFQAYYPDYCDQLREKCGENFDWVAKWLYPGMVFLGGSVGGLSYNVNLLVTGIFAYVQHYALEIAWDMANDARCKEAQTLCKQADDSIDKGRLRAAGDLIGQAEAVLKKLTDPIRYQRFNPDEVKLRLVKAYLKLKTPKYEEAKKWADSIKNVTVKTSAFKLILKDMLS